MGTAARHSISADGTQARVEAAAYIVDICDGLIAISAAAKMPLVTFLLESARAAAWDETIAEQKPTRKLR